MRETRLVRRNPLCGVGRSTSKRLGARSCGCVRASSSSSSFGILGGLRGATRGAGAVRVDVAKQSGITATVLGDGEVLRVTAVQPVQMAVDPKPPALVPACFDRVLTPAGPGPRFPATRSMQHTRQQRPLYASPRLPPDVRCGAAQARDRPGVATRPEVRIDHIAIEGCTDRHRHRPRPPPPPLGPAKSCTLPEQTLASTRARKVPGHRNDPTQAQSQRGEL